MPLAGLRAATPCLQKNSFKIDIERKAAGFEYVFKSTVREQMRIQKLLRSALEFATKPKPVSRSQAVLGMERLAAVTHAITSVERLIRHDNVEVGGFADWQVHRFIRTDLPSFQRGLVDLLSGKKTIMALQVGRLAASCFLLAPGGDSRLRFWANTFLSVEQMNSGAIWGYGGDGSDQAGVTATFLAAIARSQPKNSRLVDAAIWAGSIQSVLSYATAGYAKLPGANWQSGNAIASLISTRVHGNTKLWGKIENHIWLTKLIAYWVLAIECLFPLVYWKGGRFSRPLILSIGAMHLGISQIIGLPRFFPAFLALHQPLEYTVSPAIGLDEPKRDDTVPTIVVLASAVLLAAGFLGSTRTRRELDERRKSDLVLTSRSGGRTSYSWTEGPERGSPIFILDGGIGTSRTAWDNISSGLRDQGHVVRYDRLCRGSSTWSKPNADPSGGIGLQVAELAAHVAEGRPVYHIGFQAGCHIGHSATLLRPSVFSGLVFIEPELLNLEPLRDDLLLQFKENIKSTQLCEAQMRFGIGWLVSNGRNYFGGHQEEKAIWPVEYEGLDERKDRRLWQAAIEEQKFIYDEIIKGQETRPATTPILNIKLADRTTEPVVAPDDDLLVVRSTSAVSHSTIRGTVPHLLTDSVSAAALVSQILDFSQTIEETGSDDLIHFSE